MKTPVDLITRRSIHSKVVNYLFNPNHKKGWPKGLWFIKALAFEPGNPKHVRMLEKQIHYDATLARFKRDSEWGERFEQELTIIGPTGKVIKGIRAAWQKGKDDGSITLMTILPPKRR